MNKDQLAEYALTEFNKTLDMRKSLDALRTELTKNKVVVADVVVSTKTHIKNLDTGLWFPANDTLKAYLPNWAYCDDTGVE